MIPENTNVISNCTARMTAIMAIITLEGFLALCFFLNLDTVYNYFFTLIFLIIVLSGTKKICYLKFILFNESIILMNIASKRYYHISFLLYRVS